MFNLLLLADIWELVVPLLVISFMVISHLWNLLRGKQNPPRPNPPRPGERPLPAPAEQTLNSEIEDFLQRAKDRREKKKNRGKQDRNQPTGNASQSAPAQQSAAAPTSATRGRDRGSFDTVSSSVQQHLGQRGFEQREQHLADKISQADENLELHLQQAFSHRLGSLESPSLEEVSSGDEKKPAAAFPAAHAVAGLLIDPERIRQAVLLKEILERPVDRW